MGPHDPIDALALLLANLAHAWGLHERGDTRFPELVLAKRISIRDVRRSADLAAGLELWFSSGAGFGYYLRAERGDDIALAANQIYNAVGRQPRNAESIAKIIAGETARLLAT